LSSIEKSQIASSFEWNFSRNWAHWMPRKVDPISSPYFSWSAFASATASSLKRLA
jgi:hypothetical protein